MKAKSGDVCSLNLPTYSRFRGTRQTEREKSQRNIDDESVFLVTTTTANRQYSRGTVCLLYNSASNIAETHTPLISTVEHSALPSFANLEFSNPSFRQCRVAHRRHSYARIAEEKQSSKLIFVIIYHDDTPQSSHRNRLTQVSQSSHDFHTYTHVEISTLHFLTVTQNLSYNWELLIITVSVQKCKQKILTFKRVFAIIN